MRLHGIDYAIIVLYFAFVLGIGAALKRFMKTSLDFFESGRSLAAWITALAFISANLGAQEVIGMAASGAKYGIMTSHFYWVGAIPAMIFVGVFMMPFYYGSKAHSVPEYLRLRFDEKTRALNAVSFAVMTIFSSGISMYVMGRLFQLLLGWDINVSIIVSAVVVLVYILLGGLTSSIYNEVVQFFLIVFGFLPLVFVGVMSAGGWSGLQARLSTVATDAGYDAGAWTQSWQHMGSPAANPMGVEWFGMAMGLGFVLSFGYWCTDFLVIQRAMAAKSMNAARRTPLLAAIPKMFFPFLVILPGMVRLRAAEDRVRLQRPTDYNMVMVMPRSSTRPGCWSGRRHWPVSCRAWRARHGFQHRMDHDIYKPTSRAIHDAHYMRVGRQATVFGTILSVATACGHGLRQHHGPVQLVFRSSTHSACHLPVGHVLGSTANGAFWAWWGMLACAAHVLTGVGADGAGTARLPDTWRATLGIYSGPRVSR